jgi:hypothetical protein
VRGHFGPINTCSFSPSGRRCVAGSRGLLTRAEPLGLPAAATLTQSWTQSNQKRLPYQQPVRTFVGWHSELSNMSPSSLRASQLHILRPAAGPSNCTCSQRSLALLCNILPLLLLVCSSIGHQSGYPCITSSDMGGGHDGCRTAVLLHWCLALHGQGRCHQTTVHSATHEPAGGFRCSPPLSWSPAHNVWPRTCAPKGVSVG